MFKDFYRDIDTLHELVKPLVYGVHLNRMNESFLKLGKEIGELLAITDETTERTIGFLAAAKLIGEKDS